jgi:DNA mismatch repair ATPase MutL
MLDPSVVLKGPERIYFYVNQRPINYVKSELKEIVTTIRTRYKDAIGLNDASSKKTPFIYIDIQMPPDEYDVNVEPNKTTILFHNKQRVINLVDKILDKVYSSISEKFFIGAAKSSSAAATAM